MKNVGKFSLKLIWKRFQAEGVYRNRFLSCFFAFCMVFGNSYYRNNSWDACMGTDWRWLKGLAELAVFYCIGAVLLQILWYGFQKQEKWLAKTNVLFEWLSDEKCFWKCFCILLLLWMPVAILCYPGGICVDVTYQIRQVLGESRYSNYQPLIHTLYVGGLVKLGNVLFHSYNMGLFLSVLLQMVILAAVLSYSITALKKAGVSRLLQAIVMGIYVLAPMYSNMATMAIKDTLFNAFVLLYMILLSQQMDRDEEDFEKTKDIKALLILAAVAVLAMLWRNNGLYIVITGNLVLGIRFLRKKRPLIRLAMLVLPLIVYGLVAAGLTQVLDAAPVPSREMLSIPLQQTARYCRDYGWDVTEEEKQVIENLVGNYEMLGDLYDPDISDPVKAMMKNDVTVPELLSYFGVWFKQFLRHPDVYLQAGFNHAYGWFYPGARNAIRYEGMLSIFSRPGILERTNRLIVRIYNGLGKVTIIHILETPAVYIWILLVMTAFWKREGNKTALAFMIPCYVSLLICIASPAFFLHPRYAFPIMVPLPYLVCRYFKMASGDSR